MRLSSLNAIPAFDVFQEHAETTGQTLDQGRARTLLPSQCPGDRHRRRVSAQGAAGRRSRRGRDLQAEVPAGIITHIMETTDGSATRAAEAATKDAFAQLGQHRPKLALFFDCVATRLRLGREFAFELDAVKQALGGSGTCWL